MTWWEVLGALAIGGGPGLVLLAMQTRNIKRREAESARDWAAHVAAMDAIRSRPYRLRP